MYFRFQKNFLSFLLILASLFQAAYEFDYHHQASWGGQCQSSSGQSPINVHTNDVIEIREIPFKYINYKTILNNCTIQNNGGGSSVTCNQDLNTWPKIKLFSDTYKFSEFHFHWGPNNSGSEHKINEHSYALELHLVHFNEKYNNFSEALKKFDDGISVLAVLFEYSNFSTSVVEYLSESFPKIKKYSSKTKILHPFSLNDFFIGLNPESFYTYMGSLTTPPCTPARWTILKDKGKTSDIVLKKFRSLHDKHGKRIVRNFRDTHPIKNGNIISQITNYLTQGLP